MPLILQHQSDSSFYSPPAMERAARSLRATVPQLPSHVSPMINPLSPPHHNEPSNFSLRPPTSVPQHGEADDAEVVREPLPALVSPAFTPPTTPGTQTPNPLPRHLRPAKSVPVDSSSFDTPRPELVERLPTVKCIVRARIPTTTGQEMWLHVYQNDFDTKEHLAIVFGSTIRSKTLDAEWPGETEMDRMVRGAYVGRLHPGRTNSRIDQLRKESGIASTPSGVLAPIKENCSGKEQMAACQMHKSGAVQAEAPLVRIHSECYTGETVWSARCDCGEQLDEAARLMSLPAADGKPGVGGVIIYLRQEGRGIGLSEKLKAYNLQDLGNDTYEANLLLRHPADARSYGLATSMLVDLGLSGEVGIRLLTNNPDKVRAVEGPGREIVVKERVAMVPRSWTTGGKEGVRGEEVEKYLSTKIEKFKHMIGT